MLRKPALDKYHDVLFKDFNEMEHLTPAERNQLKRYRFCFTQSLENPSIPDKVLRDYLINEFDISSTQAYIDIQNMRILLGKLKKGRSKSSKCPMWFNVLIIKRIQRNKIGTNKNKKSSKSSGRNKWNIYGTDEF